MSDEELKIFSARAIFPEKQIHIGTGGLVWIRDYYPKEVKPRMAPWNPLADGHQAMMLVEKLELTIIHKSAGQYPEAWFVFRVVDVRTDPNTLETAGRENDLRRAIVACAAVVWQNARRDAKPNS